MSTPILIEHDSFQRAWLEVISRLKQNSWEFSNLVVNIKQPLLLNKFIHKKVDHFASEYNKFSLKVVASTIFPFGFYYGRGSSGKLYDRYLRFYNRPNRKKSHGWGTYFYRMIHYDNGEKTINQLDKIINAINSRRSISSAAYTIVIEKPGGETIKPLGAPCLNYIAIRLSKEPKRINFLCVYRNHDFLQRAYGNYWGLSMLQNFIATETNFKVGELTCVSSHAFVNLHKQPLTNLIKTF